TISPNGMTWKNTGTSQTFTISPAVGYKVASVLVDGVSVGAVKTTTLTNIHANHTVVTSFVPGSCTLTTIANGVGSITRNPDLAQYPAQSTVQLTAVPGQGTVFVEWLGDADGSGNPVTLTMDGDKTVSATFADTTRPAVLVLAPNGGESILIGTAVLLKWKATDNVGVTSVDLLVSRYG